MCLEISNFDFVACWGAPSVVAMPSRWVSTSDRLKGLPSDLLQTRGHKSGFTKDDKKARSEFQRSARTWGAIVHQGGGSAPPRSSKEKRSGSKAGGWKGIGMHPREGRTKGSEGQERMPALGENKGSFCALGVPKHC